MMKVNIKYKPLVDAFVKLIEAARKRRALTPHTNEKIRQHFKNCISALNLCKVSGMEYDTNLAVKGFMEILAQEPEPKAQWSECVKGCMDYTGKGVKCQPDCLYHQPEPKEEKKTAHQVWKDCKEQGLSKEAIKQAMIDEGILIRKDHKYGSQSKEELVDYDPDDYLEGKKEESGEELEKLIDSIHLDYANLDYIQKHNKINGTLREEIKRIFKALTDTINGAKFCVRDSELQIEHLTKNNAELEERIEYADTAIESMGIRENNYKTKIFKLEKEIESWGIAYSTIESWWKTSEIKQIDLVLEIKELKK